MVLNTWSASVRNLQEKFFPTGAPWDFCIINLNESWEKVLVSNPHLKNTQTRTRFNVNVLNFIFLKKKCEPNNRKKARRKIFTERCLQWSEALTLMSPPALTRCVLMSKWVNLSMPFPLTAECRKHNRAPLGCGHKEWFQNVLSMGSTKPSTLA